MLKFTLRIRTAPETGAKLCGTILFDKTSGEVSVPLVAHSSFKEIKNATINLVIDDAFESVRLKNGYEVSRN